MSGVKVTEMTSANADDLAIGFLLVGYRINGGNRTIEEISREIAARGGQARIFIPVILYLSIHFPWYERPFRYLYNAFRTFFVFRELVKKNQSPNVK